MLNSIYQLVAPRRFELVFRDELISESSIIVRPTHLSICNADQRYYQGTRGAEIMSKKLPMALIHEAIGEVVFDATRSMKPGTPVVLIPNLPSTTHPIIAENYLRSSKFRASSADGFMQEFLVTVPSRIVQLPEGTKAEVAAFTELVSVSMHAIHRFAKISHESKSTIGVWGDGNLGYITALLLRKLFEQSNILVFGHNEDKLSDFTFVNETYLTSDTPTNIAIDHAFECVGGLGSISAIDQIIDRIEPEGTISLMGVSEEPVPINTRMILEKGLRVFGSSRSGYSDFKSTLDLYGKDPSVPAYLERIVGQIIDVSSIEDMSHAFEADIQKRLGKTVLRWEI